MHIDIDAVFLRTESINDTVQQAFLLSVFYLFGKKHKNLASRIFCLFILVCCLGFFLGGGVGLFVLMFFSLCVCVKKRLGNFLINLFEKQEQASKYIRYCFSTQEILYTASFALC